MQKKHINKGTIISAFTGNIEIQDKRTLITAESSFVTDISESEHLVIDGTRHGNITKFIQHLPTQEQLVKYNIRDTTNVATQNLSLEVIEMQVGLQTGILIASEDIKPGEIIGCSYVDSFWKNRGEPFLFQKNGKKLSNYNHDHSVKNFF